MNNDITDLNKRADALIREAFERGYRAGEAAMKAKILRAASDDTLVATAVAAPIPAPLASSNTGPEPNRGAPPAGRVERGTVRRVLGVVMSADVGQTIPQITAEARKIDGRVSVTSIPNELRRNKDSLYRQDGDRWFLLGDAGKETAGPASNESPAEGHSQGGSHGPSMYPPGSA